ncbi:MAG: hypothetical protein H6706_13310 [Myxococcales bacterium]|nr:hypothetical protein [Myxococcales bacterium]
MTEAPRTSATLTAFTLAGLGAGAIVGLLDASRLPDATAVLAALALDVLGGGLAGLAAGVLFPFIPPALRALPLVRRAATRLRPGAQDALHDRCRTVTWVWLLALGLPALLFTLRLAEPILLGRIRSRFLAAAAVALVGLAAIGFTLALSAPVLAGVSRALERLVRRRPALTPLTRPDANLALAVVVGLVALLLTRPDRGPDPTLLAATAVLAVGITIGGELLLDLRRRLPWLLLLLCGAGVSGYVSLRGGPPAALHQAPAAGLALRIQRRLAAPPVEPGAAPEPASPTSAP